MDWTWLILLVFTGLATFRLTRLIVADDFPLVRIPREWVVGEKEHTYVRDPEHPQGGYWLPQNKHVGQWYHWFGELISCPWCASGWVSLGLVCAVAWFTPRDAALVDWLLLWLAAWGIGAVTAAKAG